jgi:CelD/BcsL family acetyltransferase involved in cellulose biosynthesis
MADTTSQAAARPAHLVGQVAPSRKGLRFTDDSLAASAGLLRDASLTSRNPFLTPEWLAAWWRHFGPSRDAARVVRCEASDVRLVALLPVYLWWRKPLRVLRFLGHGPSDLLAPPTLSGASPAQTAVALRDYLADSADGWDVFIGEQLPATPSLAPQLAATVIRKEGSPSLEIRGTWEDYLSSLSANLRQQIRRRERNLARSHAVRFRLTESHDSLRDDLDVLFRLHERRWGAESRKFQSRRAFHQDFAEQAFERGWLRLWTLEVDGRPVAVWYGIRFAGIDTYYQSARDPDLEHASIGLVLLAHTIREAHRDGASEYRFGRGGEAYKYRMATRDDGLETVMVARNWRGATAVRAASCAGRLPRRPLAVVRRLIGD